MQTPKVQAVCGLIQDKDFRVMYENPAYEDPSSLSRGYLVHQPVGEMGYFQKVQYLLGPDPHIRRDFVVIVYHDAAEEARDQDIKHGDGPHIGLLQVP